MKKPFLQSLVLIAAVGFAAPIFADDDATLHQVYTAAQSGHLDQAQQMMTQVLRDHPNSGKAHYVEAELDARQGQFAAARSELSTAERLEPGLPFAKPDSVRELQSELSSRAPGGQAMQLHGGPSPSFPFAPLLILLAIGAVIWMVIRSRRIAAYQQYAQNQGRMYPPPNGMPVNYGPQGPMGMGPNAGGMGSGIMGGLASGLAVGAGVVAGEELAHHFLDGNRRPEGSYFPDNNQGPGFDPNSNMGGSDFGVQDNGSWDDNSSVGGDFGGGGGGDDWS